MLNKLNDEQVKGIEVCRDKWIKVGLQTGPIDRDAAIVAANKAYKCAGLELAGAFDVPGLALGRGVDAKEGPPFFFSPLDGVTADVYADHKVGVARSPRPRTPAHNGRSESQTDPR